MKVTNLIFHIITLIIMLPDLVFVGLNSLVGLGYCNGIELVYVLTADLLFGGAFLAYTVGAIIMFTKYKSTRPKVYFTRELLAHGLSALCFAVAIIYIIDVRLNSSSKGTLFAPAINLIGLVVCIIVIIINVIVHKKIKRAPLK